MPEVVLEENVLVGLLFRGENPDSKTLILTREMAERYLIIFNTNQLTHMYV